MDNLDVKSCMIIILLTGREVNNKLTANVHTIACHISM
jgi:hypothetical protein